MIVKIVPDWQVDPLIRRDHRRSIEGRAFHDVQLVFWPNATCDCESRYNVFVASNLLRNNIFADPNVPADRITRPVPGFTFTMPENPGPTAPPLEHSTSTPVMCPPSRMSLLTLVLVQRPNDCCFAALTRYVASGPWRSAFSMKNVLCPYVWFF
jgi:hypothetical protein